MESTSDFEPEDIFDQSYETEYSGASTTPDDAIAEPHSGHEAETESQAQQDDAIDESSITAPEDWGTERESPQLAESTELAEIARPEGVQATYEGKYDASGFPRTDVYDKVRSLNLPQESVVVIGSSAVETVVGPDVRRAQDLDLAVSEEVYGYLRNQRGMEEIVSPDGDRRLVQDGFDIAVGWSGKSLEQLQESGYEHEGVNVAGLPAVYEYKERRGEPKDAADLQILRDRLYGDKPLPLGMLKGEMEFVKGSIPERLHGRPELQVAANGLYVVRTVFGTEGENVRAYNGSIEQGQVPATYHAWEHSAYGVRDGQRNFDAVEEKRQQEGQTPLFGDDDRLAAAAGYANHDAVLGHGRRAANPTAHDERQSADLAVKHLEAVGVTDSVLLEKTHAGVMSTTFNEAKKGQDIEPSRGHMAIQEVFAGSDMAAFRRTDAPLGSVRLTVEDLSRVGAGYDKPLQRLVDDLNRELPEGAAPVRVQSVEDGLRLIDQHPNYLVTKAGATPEEAQHMTLREAFATHLAGSGRFMGGYQFPPSWGLGTPEQQAQNAAFMGELELQVRSGELSAQEALRKAKEYSLRRRA